jgi:hypothetical protein
MSRMPETDQQSEKLVFGKEFKGKGLLILNESYLSSFFNLSIKCIKSNNLTEKTIRKSL